jgi:uncharacterized membrane protein
MVKRLRSSFSDRRIAVLAALGALSAVVVGLVAFRVAYTQTADNAGLAWNLFLAWIPLGLALLLYDRRVHRAGPATLAGIGLAWLLFFPNAPYIVTDFTHLAGDTGEKKFWFDGVLIATAATTGLLLGFVSLYLLQAMVRSRLGARCAWLFVFATLGLSSFGVYLGRVQRWNSWDVFVRPGSLAAELGHALVDPLAHPRPIGVSLLFTSFLAASYLVFYRLARASSLLD